MKVIGWLNTGVYRAYSFRGVEDKCAVYFWKAFAYVHVHIMYLFTYVWDFAMKFEMIDF